MSTTITTTNPVRSDVTTEASSEPTRPHSRAWALAGLGAAVASIAGTVGAGLVHGVYAESTMGDDVAILESLGDDVTFIPGHGPTSTFGNESGAIRSSRIDSC